MNENSKNDVSKVLSHMANAVAGQLDKTILLKQIIDTTMEILHAEVCSIFIEDDNDSNIIKCVAGSGFAEKIVDVAQYNLGEGFTGSVAKFGGEYNIKSKEELKNIQINHKKVWKGNFDTLQWPSRKSKFRNLIALPLKIKSHTFGVIKAENKISKYGDYFSEDDLLTFKTIANVISLTLENVKLHENTLKLHKKNEEQAKRIPDVLAYVANAVVGYFDMQTLLDQIISTTMEVLNAEVSSIFLIDENEPDFITCVAGSGFAEKIVGNAKYRIGEGLTGTIAYYEGYNSKNRKEHEQLKFNNTEAWLGKFDNLQWPSGESEFRNGIALPLKIKDQTLGVIKAENKEVTHGDFFSDEDMTVFKTIANVTALAIQNTRLHQKADEQSKSIQMALSDVAGAVVGHYNMQELLNRIVKITMRVLNAKVCSIFLEDKEKEPGVLKCVAGSGFAEKIIETAKYNFGEGFTGSVAKYGGEYNIKSRAELKKIKINSQLVWGGKFDTIQWPSGKSEFRNLLALQLKIKEKIEENVLGVIKVENKIGGEFTDQDLTILKTIANVIALTIEKTRLQIKIEEQLKAISAMAGHKILNYTTRYVGISRRLKRALKLDRLNHESILQIVNDIDEATADIQRMVEEFRKYGTPIILEKKMVNINEILEKEIWYTEPPDNIKIHKNFIPNMPEIEIDTGRFSESIKEILRNSKRMLLQHKEGGNIYISTQLKMIDTTKDQYVCILIEDDGNGFPQNIPVFEPFRSSDEKRTGLGLATVKENIEAHGGSIKSLNKDNRGACIELILPLKEV